MILLIAFVCLLAAIFGRVSWEVAIAVTVLCVVFEAFLARGLGWWPWGRRGP